MNTKLFSLFTAILIFVSVVSANRAQALEVKRTQFVMSLGAERPVTESGLGLRSSIVSFRAPGVTDIYFFYAGLTYEKKFGDWKFWTSPQLVAVTNFFADHDALGPALWLSLSNQWFKLFLEPEAYFGSEGRKGYYGFYSVDFKPLPWIELGPQLEQVHNDGMSYKFGPHISVSKDAVTCTATWFMDSKQEFQQFRLMVGATF